MVDLYPQIKPNCSHSLAVGGGHTLYVEEYGQADGLPVVFLHGGPGAGCEAWHARFFDPEVYRIVLFDQRGCGRSTPHASLEHNTTADLVADIERLRVFLDVEQWLVFGGSWGSSLALVYAQTHPERVTGLVVRGVFLCRPRDVQWFYQDGANGVFPDYWREFMAPIPAAERDDFLGAYHRRLTGDDEIARMAAAKAWSVWEGRAATLGTNPGVVNHFADPFIALSLARIECHYFVNDCFLEPDQILRDMSRLADIPGTIVHGRYDMVCLLRQADELHASWPLSDLWVVPEAGHSAREPGIVDALVRATNGMPSRIAAD